MLNEHKEKEHLIKELYNLRKENAELRLQLEQRESEMQYKLAQVVEHLPNPIVLTDFNGRIIYVNKALEHHSDYSRAELMNEPVGILNAEKNAEEIQEEIYEIIKSRKVWSKEITQKRKDGSTYLGDFKIFPVYGEGTTPITWASVQQDITIRKQAEDALQQHVLFLQTLIDTIPNPIYYKDVNGLFQGCNKAFEVEMGFSREEILGKSIYDIRTKELADVYTEKDAELLNTSGIQVYETIIPFSDGTLHDVVLHKGAYEDSNGEITGLVGVIVDINERKQMEKSLRESEEKYRDLFENANDIFYTADLKGNFTSVNQAALKTYGYTRDELLQLKLDDIMDPKYIPTALANFQKKLCGAEEKTGPYEVLTYTKSGLTVWIEVSSRLIRDKGKPIGIQGIARDITERKKMQQEIIMKSEMLDAAMDSIFAHDLDGNFLYSNEVGYKARGYSKKELLQLNLRDLEHPDFPKWLNKRIEILSKEGKTIFESADVCKDGSVLPVEINSRLMEFDNKKIILSVVRDISERKQAERALKESEALYRTIFENTGTSTIINKEDTTIALVNTEFELLSGYSKRELEGKKSWQEFFTEENRKQMLEYHYDRAINPDTTPRKYETKFVDRYGAIKNVLVTVGIIPNTQTRVASLLDITEFKRFQQEIIRLEQLNLVGQMAAGIGHEVRNPMTTVRGFLQMFKDKNELKIYKEYIELMIEELDRANSIITQFLSLAKDKPVEKKKMNLNNIIMTLFPLIQADVFKSNMYTQLELNDIPDLLLDEKEIRQLILNLVRNGLEEMAAGKTITIRTFIEANEVVLAVKDQGKGIESEVLNKLGTPFLTTKEQGTGLGLAVCYSIAARHKATIEVETSTEGSTFFVRFKFTN